MTCVLFRHGTVAVARRVRGARVAVSQCATVPSRVVPVSTRLAEPSPGRVSGYIPGGSDKSQGIWPAHWMMPDVDDCWPSKGEIDIMEMVNGDGVTHGTYH